MDEIIRIHNAKDIGSSNAEPIPNELKFVIDHLIKHKIVPRIDQIIVNHYKPGQGISAHTDISDYGDIILSLGLGEDTNFLFRGENEVVKALHPRRSLLVFGGKYRHKYTHEIPGRKTVDYPYNINDGKILKKQNDRISLTMRYMKN